MEKSVKTRNLLNKRILIWVLLIIGLCAMEFPGVFFFGKIARPFIFGMPFIYGYILCVWAYMCAVLLFAYKCDWGRVPAIENDALSEADDD